MLCEFLLYSKVNQLYIYMYPLFFGFPSHLGHHRASQFSFFLAAQHGLRDLSSLTRD